MREQLRKELQHIEFSDEQKNRLKKHMNTTKKPPVQRSFVPIIVPAFITLTLFMIYVTIQAPTPVELTTAALPNASPLTLSVALWLTATLMLMMGNYSLLLLNCQKVKRWQGVPIVEKLKKDTSSRRNIWFVLTLLVMQGLIWLGAFFLATPQLYVQGWFTFFAIVCIFLCLTYCTRNHYKARCPHCHTAFTNKQIRKKSWRPYNLACDNCNQTIYIDPEATKSGAPIFMIVPTVLALQWTDLYMGYLFILFIASLFIIWRYILPYNSQYTDEQKPQPPLW